MTLYYMSINLLTYLSETNWKSHKSFRLIPMSMTLNDLEGRYLTQYRFSGDGCAVHTIGSKRQLRSVENRDVQVVYKFCLRKVKVNLQSKFNLNRTTRSAYMTSYRVQDGSRGGGVLFPVSYLMMALSFEGHNLSAHQISSTYLNPRLRYLYFRFGKTNVRQFFRLRF